MAEITTKEICGWGRYPCVNAATITPAALDEVRSGQDPVIMRGQGRSYGDAAILSRGLVVLTEKVGRVISFDQQNGLLEAEAGLTLAEILRAFVPYGWFPSVVPGTKFVSLGGSIAADIHGKNHHHDGTFGTSLKRLHLIQADGGRKNCSPDENSDLFWATVGGMGLTGIIADATLQLFRVKNPYIVARHHQSRNLDESLRLLQSRDFDDQYTVVWLDCLARKRGLGRGILIRGHHAEPEELKKEDASSAIGAGQKAFDLRFDFPSWLLNPLTVGAFNEIYYRWQGLWKRPFVCHYDSFLFPLDRLGNWNRMYGRRGFVQYQCVFPLEQSRSGLQTLLEECALSGRSSFLAVLKRFGPEGEGLLSFPREGYTLTLDFPVSGPDLFKFLDGLDEIVLQNGGRVYLAKDARLRPEVFRRMYPRLDEWLRIKSRVDPENRFDSDLARRLDLKPGVSAAI